MLNEQMDPKRDELLFGVWRSTQVNNGTREGDSRVRTGRGGEVARSVR
jgi:hypothetical protein